MICVSEADCELDVATSNLNLEAVEAAEDVTDT